MTTQYEAHPYAEIFPLDEGQNLWDLAADIGANGQQDDIILFEGKVLDGRRRQLACFKAGVEARYTKFKGTAAEALELVMSKNLHRRHLNEDQRAMAAAAYAKAKVGGDKKSATYQESVKNPGKTTTKSSSQNATMIPNNKEAAETFRVNEAKVDRAKKVLNKGGKVLKDAVNDGTVTVSDASTIADQPKHIQAEAVQRVAAGEAKTARAAVEQIEAEEADADEEPEPVKDAEGEIVPEHAREAFAVADTITSICREIDGMARRIDDIAKGPGGRLIRLESVKQQLKDAKGNLWANRASHVCPYCHGAKKECECCKGEGWVNKVLWSSAPGNNARAKR